MKGPRHLPKEHTYSYGTPVDLTANPANGWYFVEWTGDLESTEKETTIRMDHDKEITANFESEKYTLSIDGVGDGVVEVDGDEVNLPFDKAYDYGAEVTLKAVPDEGWEFDNWTGTDEKGEEITLTMNEDKEIAANFENLDEYELMIDINGEGTTDPKEGIHTYYEGEEVTIEAEPDLNWGFEKWTGDENGTLETITLTMDEDKKITAVFKEWVPSKYLVIKIEGEGSTTPSEGSHTYEEGENVTITAIPAVGWEFAKWSGDVTGTENKIIVKMDEDIVINTVFQEEEGLPWMWFGVVLAVMIVILIGIFFTMESSGS